MTGRDERVARNEAISRDINERIEEAHEGTSRERYIRMVCECGRESCDRVIAITRSEYEHVRSDPIRFAVLRDHVVADVERVIDETDRFVVVAKRAGTPADVAIEEDPRS
jgi:5-bromo-4-chloroindolyl phosphate hydrolysis protein